MWAQRPCPGHLHKSESLCRTARFSKTLTDVAATQLDIWLLRGTEGYRYIKFFKFTTWTMSIHRFFTKWKAPDDPKLNGVPPSTRRPPSGIKQNSKLNFLIHCFIILQHNYLFYFIFAKWLLHVNQYLKLETISKSCIFAMLVIVDLQRTFRIVCVTTRIFMICLLTTCHMLSYNYSLDDRHQPESQRKSAHPS